MNEPIRRLSVLALVLFLALLGGTTWVQFFKAGDLNSDARNVRTLYREYGNFRGPILVDGQPVVYSVPVDDPFNYQRTYVNGSLYAPVTGYYSIVFGRSAIEQTHNSLLAGTADSMFWNRLGDLFAGQEQRGASVELTIRAEMQRVAAEALGDRKGAVVALDPRTGEILAMVTSPTFDPALLAGHNTSEVNTNWQALLNADNSPLVNRAIHGDTWAPGSTFKLLVAATALEAGYTPETEVNAPRELALPNSSATIRNYGGSACSPSDRQSLADALRISCNTAFADIGMSLGWDRISDKAEAFGWGDNISVPLNVTRSRLSQDPDAAQTAQSAIGQFDVRTTPMQMAMVVSAIANDGVLMEPYLVKTVRAPDLKVLEQTTPQVYSTPMNLRNAQQLRDMMVGVVDNGTGTAARINGVSVAGKTGTAESGTDAAPHTWFVGFAPANDPVVAVAVFVENGGDLGNEATGGKVSAPIARQVMEKAIELEGRK